MGDSTTERKPPRVDIVVVDPKRRLRERMKSAAARGIFASAIATLLTSVAASRFLPWYRTPTVDDAQPCNCRGPVRDALERALTEALVAEAAIALVAFVVVGALFFAMKRGHVDGR